MKFYKSILGNNYMNGSDCRKGNESRKGFFLTPSSFSCTMHKYKEEVKKKPFLPSLSLPLSLLLPFLLALIFFATTSNALNIEDKLSDPKLEATAAELFHEIRCMVCDGEALVDSRSDFAKSLRQIIRNHLAAGQSKDVIINELRAGYGDAILMNPPIAIATYLLWVGPALILLIGAVYIIRR